MSDDKTPSPGQSPGVSHAFPSFIKDASGKKKPSKSPRHQFVPLFSEGTAVGQHTRAIAPAATRQPVQDDPLETATCRGYERGYADGREDACALVQNDLAPIIDDLQRTLAHSAKAGKEIARTYSINSLKLALAIVEKITGEASLFSLKDLSAAQSIINEKLLDSFGLNLRLSPDDHRRIENLSACNNHLDWKVFSHLHISSDAGIKSGAVQSITQPINLHTIQEEIETALDSVLDLPSLKLQE